MKKCLVFALAAVLLCASIAFTAGETAAAAQPEISVILDGERLQFDVPPQITDSRTLVPVRAIFEALGMELEWNCELQTIWATRGDFAIFMAIGDTEMQVGTVRYTAPPRGGREQLFEYFAIEIDVPPMLVNSRTLVPLRAISESMGATVDWDDDTRTVTIETFSAIYAMIFNVADSIVEGDFEFYSTYDLTDEQLEEMFPGFGLPIVARAFYSDDGSLLEVRAETIGNTHIRAAQEELAQSVTVISQTTPQISYVHGVAVRAHKVYDSSAEMYNRFQAEFMLEDVVYHISLFNDMGKGQARLTEIVNRIIFGGAASDYFPEN